MNGTTDSQERAPTATSRSGSGHLGGYLAIRRDLFPTSIRCR